MILNITNLIEDETIYYYYHNWQAGQNNMIHKGDCRFCNYGFGMRHNVNRGENGVWVGPFSSLELAHQYLNERNLNDAEEHSCCH